MESGAKATGYKNGKRKVIEHAVLFQLKADTHTKVKEDMVRGLADLKEDCPEWVVAESAGQILQPSQAKGASVGLFMRLFSTRDLDVYFASKQKNDMASKYIVPFMTVSFGPIRGLISLTLESSVSPAREMVLHVHFWFSCAFIFLQGYVAISSRLRDISLDLGE